MNHYKIIIINLFIIILSLVIGDYLLSVDEAFQSLSKLQVQDMSMCIPKSYTASNPKISTDPSCSFIKYYNTEGTLKSGNFSNLPDNVYIDENYILQPIPAGNKVTHDRKGYIPFDKSVQYSSSQINYKENAINPSICKPNEPDFNKSNPKVCYDVSYVEMDVNGKPLFSYNKIRIPNGYYINSGNVEKIPYGYTIDPYDNTKIAETNKLINEKYKTKYNALNFNDIEYHTDPTKSNNTDESTAGPGKMWVLDKDNKLVAVPYGDVNNNTLYYEPGSFRFGSSNYVPNYEETVYLSKLTNISTITPIQNTSAMGGGFCDYYKNNPDTLEEKCNSLDTNTCASTSCCVLLGGQKCVHGNENGPKFKSNYSNFIVTNPEFYYYQGKCYGNCH